jgi:hypothetical protein
LFCDLQCPEMGFNMSTQLEFFVREKSELEIMREDMDFILDSNDKVRKSLYARHGELAKKFMELHERVRILERNICRGEIKQEN